MGDSQNFTFLDQFRDIEESPTQGGTSKMLFATRIADDLKVAVKLVPTASVILNLAFQRELHALGRLSHPNIIRLVDREAKVWFQEKQFGAIVMPKLSETLDRRVKREPYLHFGVLLNKLVIPLSSALAYAHENGTAHRDIKPSNIMFDGETPMLLDFGISKFTLTEQQNQTVGVWNSGYFTPDETGTEYQQDVYSFAMTVLEAFVGEPIRSFERAKAFLTEQPVDSSRPHIPLEAAKILLDCLSYRPEDRPSSMKEVHQLWKNHLKGGLQSQGRRRVGFFIKGRVAETVSTWQIGDMDPDEYLVSSLNSEELWILQDKKSEDAFFLVTPNFSLKAKFSESKPSIDVLSARELDSSALKYYASSATPISDIGLRFEILAMPKSSPEFVKGVELLGRALANHQAKKLSRGDSHIELDSLVGRWRSLLDAWEQTSSKGFEPLYFTSHSSTDQNFEKFTIEVLPDLPITGLALKIKGRKGVLGEIVDVSLDSNQILVRCNDRNRRGIPATGALEITMSAGDVASYKRISQAIDSVNERSSSRPDLGLLIAEPLQNTIGESHGIINWKSELDDSKKIAVTTALAAKDFCVVQGPPGTGKTQFIAELVWQELLRNPEAKILLVSQTHVALDNAIERLERLGLTKIVRLGDPLNPSIAQNSIKYLARRKQEKWAIELQERAEKFATEEANKTGLDGKQVQALIEISAAKKAAMQIMEIRGRIDAEEALGSEDSVAQFNISVLKVDLQIYLDEFALRMQRVISNLTGQLSVARLDEPDITYLELLRETILVGVSGQEQLDQILETIDLHAQWLLRAAVSKDIAPIFMLSQQIMAGTCLGFATERSIEYMNFDVCILDEASKATSLEAIVPLARSNKWVLVGDTNQLKAKYFNLPSKEDELEELSLSKEDLNDNIFSKLSAELPENLRTSLEIQYRMHPSIGTMISKLFYQDKLKNGTSAGRHPLVDKYMLGSAVQWISTSNGLSQEKREVRGSRFNEVEVKAVVRTLKDFDNWVDRAKNMGMFKHCEDELARLGPPTVLVLSPYAAQLNRIYQSLLGWKPQHFLLKINSVDAVQGHEDDLVFFSPVLSGNNSTNLGFLGNEDFQRINVALSRARHGVKIIGDSSFWKGTNSPLQRCLEYIELADDCEVTEIEY